MEVVASQTVTASIDSGNCFGAGGGNGNSCESGGNGGNGGSGGWWHFAIIVGGDNGNSSGDIEKK